MSNNIDTIKSKTVSNILDSIRKKIILQEYKPESMLTETELAKEFNSSRGTIREALKELSSEGLLVTLSNGRRRVVGISVKFIDDLYSMRKLLECRAVEEILKKENVGFSALAAAVDDFQKVNNDSEEGFSHERALVNSNFHRTLIEMADNIPLMKCWVTIEPLIDALANINSVHLETKNHQVDYIDTHKEIFRLLISKDSSIVDYISYHVEAAKNDTLIGLGKNGVFK
ncbi:GntR family transcriptional regulator [Robertmurraya massiliosenegalensis]|uniref:GntR family transcriptional regulator n=1 Tax=Robertmurraya TaxID=2837507 RepID=UPI0039A7166B